MANTSHFEQKFIELLNEIRISEGRQPLGFNSQLNTAAQQKTALLISQDRGEFFNQDAFDARVKSTGYDPLGAQVYSEVFFARVFDVEQGLDGLLNVNVLRQRLLDNNFFDFGFEAQAFDPNTSRSDPALGPIVMTGVIGAQNGRPPQLVGVVFDDQNGDFEYTIDDPSNVATSGEGVSGVQVQGASTDTTGQGGGYTVDTSGGLAEVTFTLGGSTASISVQMGGLNQKVDVIDQAGGGEMFLSYANRTVLGAGANDLLLLNNSNGVRGEGNNAGNLIIGGSGGDVLRGFSGNDELRGRGGDDTLRGDAGDDKILGGDGVDTLVLTGSRAQYRIAQSSEAGFLELAASFEIETFKDIELVSFSDQTVSVETLTAELGAGVINGTDQDDNLVGAAQDEEINGLPGNDMINGGAGNDRLFGGPGADMIIASAGIDEMNGGTEIDVADYSTFSVGFAINLGRLRLQDGEIVEGNPFARDLGDLEIVHSIVQVEDIISTDADDVVFGNPALNTFYAGDGDDQVNGKAGDDTLYGEGGDDLVVGAAGEDWIEGGAGNDILRGGTENDSLFGGDGDDTLLGGPGDDLLSGGAGDDLLRGGPGNDIAVLSGARSFYSVSFSGDDVILESADERETLVDIETVRFADGDVSVASLAPRAAGGAISGRYFRDENANALYDTGEASIVGRQVQLLQSDGVSSVIDLSGAAVAPVFTDTNGAYRFENLAAGQYVVKFENSDLTLDFVTPNFGDDTRDSDVLTNNDGRTGLVSVIGGQETAHVDAGVTLLTAPILATEGPDVLLGTRLDDEILALGGDDLLVGGAGADILNGGEGFDQVDYRSEGGGSGVTVDRLTGVYIDTFGDADTLISIEQVFPTDFADTLIGSNVGETLFGLGGNDQISGNAGDDTLIGGEGDDMIDGGAGNDVAVLAGARSDYSVALDGSTVVLSSDFETERLTNVEVFRFSDGGFLLGALFTFNGSEGDDTLLGTAGDDTINGLDGNDAISGLAGADSIDGGDGDDTLRGGDGNDFLDGNGGADRLFGEGGDDTLDLSAGDLLVDGGDGTDRLILSLDFDEYNFDFNGDSFVISRKVNSQVFATIVNIEEFEFPDRVRGLGELRGDTGENQTLIGDDGDNILRGGNGDDFLDGNGGADQLFGEAGNDVFDLSAGDILLDGGVGTDRLILSFAFNDYNFDFRENSFIISLKANDNVFAEIINIEEFQFTDGLRTRDELGGGSSDPGLTLIGTDDADTLVGGGGDDFLDGNGGGDRIFGNDGDDTIDLSAGDLLIDGGDGVDTLILSRTFAEYNFDFGQNSFVISVKDRNDVFAEIVNVERFEFADGVRTLEQLGSGVGGAQALPASQINASELPEIEIFGDQAENTLYGGEERNVMRGGANDDFLDGGAGDDWLGGDRGGDRLLGGDGDDILVGGAGDDSLSGDAGDDVLIGGFPLKSGSGHDANGADIFEFAPGGGNDVVRDFTPGEDRLDVSAYAFNAGDFSLSSAEAQGDDVLIHLAEGESILLEGVTLTSLSEDNFIF